MRKITLKFFIKKFVRESLVIFWNLLLVFANHDFNILKETNLPADLASNELMNKMQLFSDNIKFILEKDKTKTQRITENYVERFVLHDYEYFHFFIFSDNYLNTYFININCLYFLFIYIYFFLFLFLFFFFVLRKMDIFQKYFKMK